MSKTWAEKLVDTVARDRELHPDRWAGAPPLYGPPVDLSKYPRAARMPVDKRPRANAVDTIADAVDKLSDADAVDARRELRRAYQREWLRRKRGAV